jgi:hypothetical protein
MTECCRRENNRITRGAWGLCLLLVAVAADAVFAAGGEVTPYGSVAGVYSDNPDYGHSSTNSATAIDALAGLRVRRGGTVSTNADVSLLYRDYVHGPFASELLPAANALVTINAVPDRFWLTAEDNLGQISTQVFDALANAERQNVNFASVGPDLLLPLPARNQLGLQARYGRVTYQHSNFDNDRYSGRLGLAHLLGEYSQISAVYDYQRIEYVLKDLYPRIDRDASFLRFSGETLRSFLELEGGVDGIKVGTAGQRHTAPHASLALQRRISSRTTLNAEYSHGYSDAGDTLRNDIRRGANPGGSLNVQPISEPFTADAGDLVLLRNGARGVAQLRANWSQERYRQNIQLDRRVHGAEFAIDYRLSPLWMLAVKAGWQRQEYLNTDVHNDRLLGNVGLTRQLGRSLQAGLVVTRTHSTGNFDTDIFTENRVSLIVSYSPEGLNSRIFDPVTEFRYFERPMRGPLSQPGSRSMPGTP